LENRKSKNDCKLKIISMKVKFVYINKVVANVTFNNKLMYQVTVAQKKLIYFINYNKYLLKRKETSGEADVTL
jgi:hypothetical protein